MTIFEAVKSTVTPRLAAEHFGLNVGRNGMVCCPFHDDRHPSMKLNEDYCYCFGCGAKGDAIEFTSNPSIPSIPCGIDGRMGWIFLSPITKGEFQ